ncbi:MAG: hypothetical protein O7C75_20780, partial [Verrucomicrobia bacterium]|nr:hypothetical protein [Verrucomicrobiota bacterium]
MGEFSMYKFINKSGLSLALLMGGLILNACSAETPASKETTVSSTALSHAQQVKACNFAKTGAWWTGSFGDLAANVAHNPVTGDTEFCEFYQFAQDYFLYLISPSSTAGLDNWENQA